MRRCSWWLVLLTLVVSAACMRPVTRSDGRAPRYSPTQGDVDRGARLGRALCVSCHGIEGDGRGPAAEGLDYPPRDFVRAVYRYRSTPTGSLPTDYDIARSIVRGLPGSSMPGFRDHLDARDVFDVVAWVKAFSPRFSEELIDDPIDIPPAPPSSPAAVARGETLYAELQCGKCHGDDGSGRGWGTDEDFTDELGRPALPRDFRTGLYKSGTRPSDLYRTLVTGVDGTRMAAYEDTLEPDDVYSLVYYVMSFRQSSSLWRWLGERPRWYEPASVEIDEPTRKEAASP